MERVDLGVAFQPLAFLSAIGKNIVNFLTPGPEIFPKATQAISDYALSNILAQPSLDLKIRAPDITLFETTLVKPTTVTLTELMPTFPSAVSSAVSPATTGNILTQIWDTLKGPTETFLDFFLTKGKVEAATSIAQSQADAQRATQAVVEAQERIIATQAQQKKEAQGILSTEAWKKATPYAIPIAAGLAIVALLLVVKKGDKKKK